MEKKETIKLGKEMKLEHIPFSKLLDPEMAIKDAYVSSKKRNVVDSIPLPNSRALDALRTPSDRLLWSSINSFGLLKPLEVAKITDEMYEELGIMVKAYPRVEYVILDGQRRYMALQKFKKLRNHLKCPEGDCLEDRVILPCLVYEYKTMGECRRHSIEDNKFSIRPHSRFLDASERTGTEGKGMPNIIPKEMTNLGKRMKKLAEEIEKENRAEE